MRNIALYAAGLAMGAANTARHNRQGYVNPRPFGGADVGRTVRHAVEVVDRLQERGHIDWTGRRTLELGPGPDLTTGAVILARGAESYRAVDLFDNRSQAHPALYRRLADVLGTPVDPARLGFTRASFPELSEITGEFDLIVSNATLEHVAEVGPVFRSLRRLAAVDARMVHHIDGQTHMRWIKDRDPLNILRYPEVVYRNVLSFPGAPNRLRASDFQRLASLHGWSRNEIVPGRMARDEYLNAFKPAGRFAGYGDDLRLLTFTLLAVRS
jgi:hypothetical protein